MNSALLALVGTFGLLIGSFLNAVIYRLPRECLSVVRGVRSRCPRCGVDLAWYDNIPLLSWLVLLRGRCRHCRAPVSVRYPLIEAFTAVAFMGLWLWGVADEVSSVGIDPMSPAWLRFYVHALVVAVLIVLSVVDLDFRILPDALTVSGIVIAPLLVFGVPSVLPGTEFGQYGGERVTALVNGLLGAALGGGGLFAIGFLGTKVFRKPAMGLGDVKMAGAMGGLLGIWVAWAFMSACFVGAVIGVVVTLVRRDRYVPFGPFLAVGTVVSMLWGREMFEAVMAYLRPV